MKVNTRFFFFDFSFVLFSVPGLLGDIGGQMGLFIGASILTILELFDYVYEVIKVKMTQKFCVINRKFIGKILGSNIAKTQA